MHKLRIIMPATLIVTLSFLAIAALPVSAESGSSNTGSGDATSTRQQKLNAAKQKMSENEQSTEATETAKTELEHQASTMVGQMRKERGQKTPEERKKQCVAHQKGLNQKFSRIGTNVQRIQDKIDNIYSNAQKYATDKSLNPDGFQDLIAKADTAKKASQDSIDDLKKVTPTSVDCNNQNVAQDVATFKAAAQDTRTKLKAYKTSVKDVLNALKLPQGRANSGNLNPSSNSQSTTTSEGSTN